MTFQDAAIESAQTYYQFLTDEGRGVTSYRVTSMEGKGEFFLLTLDGKLSKPESVQIRIHNTVYSQNQVEPICYDEVRRVLKVHPLSGYRESLEKAPLSSVSVISDLRFLVKRVEDWYKRYGAFLRIPRALPQIGFPTLPALRDTPSMDQRDAICGALSTPFAYIWGAPGTGKTRFVLARCVLLYIQTGKRILITAPTNNAVEQTLYGVLSVLEEAGVSLKGILRLGVASSKFAEYYPSLCEDAALAKQLTDISAQIMAVQNLLVENEELLKLLGGAAQWKEFEAHINKCAAKIPPLFEQLRNLLRTEADDSNALAILNGKNILITRELEQAKKDHTIASSRVKGLTARVEKYSGRIRKALMPGRYNQYVLELQQAVAAVDSLAAEMAENKKQLQENAINAEQKKRSLDEHRAEAITYQQTLSEMTMFWKELSMAASKVITVGTVDALYTSIEDLLAKGQELVKDAEKKYALVQNLSEQELLDRKRALNNELEQHKREKEETEARSVGERIKECNVLAATVDTCLSRVLPDGDYRPDHVFLDEAGYCSLIKGVTLTAYNCPLTFLGDHMQLPPVCEMNDENISIGNCAPVSLWAQSALFTEEALTEHPEDVFREYLDHSPASFRQMEKYDLIHTYRFGESLAQTLASEVYTEDFHGAQNHDTNIYFLPAPKLPGSSRRTSLNECAAITRYLQASGERNVGIITPYKAQRDKLKAALSYDKELADAVMTVHGSQGREWDVVLLSVVDTTDKWFTDSLKQRSNGKKVINTAVSRAKRKLILVCDVDYWQTQRHQLIGKLLSIAEEL